MTIQHAERLCRALMIADSGDAAVAARGHCGSAARTISS